jgi:RNA polymerase sigma-70 factor (ECF subfamily)
MNAISLSVEGHHGGSAWKGAEVPVLLRGWIARAQAGGISAMEASRPSAAVGSAERTAADPADWADVQAALGGDGDAFRRLVQRHQQTLGAYLWRFTRDRGAREELVHDVFVEAYFSLAGYQGRGAFGAWLKSIATRLGYRFWQRRERRRRELPLPEDTLIADDHAAAARQAGETVHCLLAQLAPRDRLVITLLHLEEHPVAEIASLTGWSEAAVKVQAHRARRRLRELCERLGIES